MTDDEAWRRLRAEELHGTDPSRASDDGAAPRRIEAADPAHGQAGSAGRAGWNRAGAPQGPAGHRPSTDAPARAGDRTGRRASAAEPPRRADPGAAVDAMQLPSRSPDGATPATRDVPPQARSPLPRGASPPDRWSLPIPHETLPGRPAPAVPTPQRSPLLPPPATSSLWLMTIAALGLAVAAGWTLRDAALEGSRAMRLTSVPAVAPTMTLVPPVTPIPDPIVAAAPVIVTAPVRKVRVPGKPPRVHPMAAAPGPAPAHRQAAVYTPAPAHRLRPAPVPAGDDAPAIAALDASAPVARDDAAPPATPSAALAAVSSRVEPAASGLPARMAGGLPICRGFELYRPTTPCRATARR